MKPSEFIKEYIEGKREFALDEKSNKVIPIAEIITEEECEDSLYNDLDEKFIDKEKLTDMEVGTCLGLEIFQIQKMIDYFRKKGLDPYNWDEFERNLKRVGVQE